MGALAKEYSSVSWYYPPNSYHCSLSSALFSLKGLQCTFAAISSTSDDLAVLGETETR